MSNTVPIPTPAMAERLRQLFAENPVIVRVVRLLTPFVGDVDGAVHGPDGVPLSRAEAAAVLLRLHAHFGELSEREVAGVLAYFVDPVLRFPFDEASERVLAKAARLDPTDRSPGAEYVREVAGSVMDHRLQYQAGRRDGQAAR